MSKKKAEALIIVANIGKTSTEKAENETESFLDKSKTLMKHIIARKIFMRKQDSINVICIGANETNNAENMDNIIHIENDLLVPTWEVVQEILNLEGTKKTSVWVEGLHVALEFIKKETVGLFVETPVVMVINDFQEDPEIIQQFDAKEIAKEVLGAKAKLVIIGKTVNENVCDLNPSERLAFDVCKKVGGVYEQVDRYLKESRFYKNPPVTPASWKCNLRIADFTIATETYVKVTEPPPFPSWKLTTRDNTVGFPPESAKDVKKDKELVDRLKNVVDQEDAIKGFKYGGKFIPFSDEDLQVTKFKGTEKSLIVRGFVKQKDLTLEYWYGKGSHVIVSGQGSDKKFYAFVTAMKKGDLVAIARRVYCANSNPKMVALFPRMEEGEPVCLVQISIPFAEERRYLKPRQEINLPSEERQKDVKDYISSLALPDDDERFGAGNFCDPFKQSKWDMLVHRALNRVPLPSMDKYLVDLVSLPAELAQEVEPVLNKLAEWVKPRADVKKLIEGEESVKVDDQDAMLKTEDELVKAAEEAEEDMKKKEELYDEINQSMVDFDEDLMDEF